MGIINTLAFIGGLGGSEVFLILVVILLLFGAKRIPELARGLGKGINEFKNAAKEVSNEVANAANDEEKTRPTTPRIGDPRVEINNLPPDDRIEK